MHCTVLSWLRASPQGASMLLSHDHSTPPLRPLHVTHACALWLPTHSSAVQNTQHQMQNQACIQVRNRMCAPIVCHTARTPHPHKQLVPQLRPSYSACQQCMTATSCEAVRATQGEAAAVLVAQLLPRQLPPPHTQHQAKKPRCCAAPQGSPWTGGADDTSSAWWLVDRLCTSHYCGAMAPQHQLLA